LSILNIIFQYENWIAENKLLMLIIMCLLYLKKYIRVRINLLKYNVGTLEYLLNSKNKCLTEFESLYTYYMYDCTPKYLNRP